MDVSAHDPDVRQIPRDELQPRSSAVRADEPDADFAIVLLERTWTAMKTHAQTRMDAEVGGVLLGRMCRDTRETPYLLIDGHVPALEAESRASNVTFTAESWTKIHESIDRDFPGASIVGWYHTHPAFGIFLSEMDVFIQRHFFDAPHQVAIVIDPVAQTHGGFAWRGGKPLPQTLLIEPHDNPNPTDLRDAFRQRELAKARKPKGLSAWLDALHPRTKLLIMVVAFIVALLVCVFALLRWTPLSVDKPSAYDVDAESSRVVGIDVAANVVCHTSLDPALCA